MLNFVIPNIVKKIIIYTILVIGLIGTGYWLYNKAEKAEAESERLGNVIKNVNMEVAVTKAKNGELIYTINSLTVKSSELKMLNSKLANSLDNLNLKVNDLQNVSNIQYKYITLLDTIQVAIKLNKFKYQFSKENKYSNVTGYINLPEGLFSLDSLVANNKKNNPYVSDLKFENRDTLLIANEFIYRRHWIFWKKVTGVRTHVSSNSPDFKLDRIETFQVTK